MIELTKDADTMICCIYKSFLQLRKSGIPKPSARRFEKNFFEEDTKLSSWSHEDIKETLLEIGRSGLVKIYIGGNFDLTDAGIIYMENRFKKGLTEVVDFLSKLIP